MADSNSKLYKEKIIDHYKNPRHFGTLKREKYKAQVVNSTCGDEVTVYLKEKRGKISDVAFKGSGCAISLAGMSMLSEKLIGMPTEEVEALEDGYMLGMLGMDSKSPRIKCAVLGLGAVKRAISGGEDDPCDFC